MLIKPHFNKKARDKVFHDFLLNLVFKLLGQLWDISALERKH